MQIFSFSPFGYEGALVAVEVDFRRGIPSVDIVGLADGAVKESRERMRSAIVNAGFEFPLDRVLVSLSPADLKKEGAGFDLAIALAVLQKIEIEKLRNQNEVRENFTKQNCANGILKNENSAKEFLENKNSSKEILTNENFANEFLNGAILVMGELELSGRVRSVRAVHAAASSAFACGIKKCIVPAANADEARDVFGMEVFAATNVQDAFEALSTGSGFSQKKKSSEKIEMAGAIDVDGILFPPINHEFSHIRGQKKLVRALQIAAAGGHNVLAIGAPGSGKTMAMKMFPSLLPLLTTEESQPVSRVYSIAGLLQMNEGLLTEHPFRSPHQTATIEGMCGGGKNCIPGEISLAHNGVLFLDEAAEFRASVLQMLRVPLESGAITLSRAGRSTTFPASFQLLLAANPCPCGNFGSKTKLCLCSTRAIELYWKKFSAPLLDRIDIRVVVENEFENSTDEILTTENSTDEIHGTSFLRRAIAKAVKAQRLRRSHNNAHLTAEEIKMFCELSESARALLRKESARYGFSVRAQTSCIKMARTIADMEGSENIGDAHIAEAIEYRKSCSNFFVE